MPKTISEATRERIMLEIEGAIEDVLQYGVDDVEVGEVVDSILEILSEQ